MFSLNILKLVLQSPGSSAKLKQTPINIMMTSNEMVYLYPNALLSKPCLRNTRQHVSTHCKNIARSLKNNLGKSLH